MSQQDRRYYRESWYGSENPNDANSGAPSAELSAKLASRTASEALVGQVRRPSFGERLTPLQSCADFRRRWCFQPPSPRALCFSSAVIVDVGVAACSLLLLDGANFTSSELQGCDPNRRG